ncbi:putative antitoxin ParD2 [Labrys miyagiensis]|uniref:Antitoxin ParD2 n=1 Tax=Labrys miyagiensis TaxID=346912 RepID=A0ABQ6CHJ1_9HYPH|nr:CopG family ribbon-helix-helix protein [Labrys miyagiensis]GLS17742.1 putative antitoxin ParD2 [Labrys miyagiensis]
MSTVPFSLRLNPDVKERLDTEAKRIDRSSSWLATQAIEAMLDARTAKEEAIRLALIEAEKGEFISSEAMHRWIDSWGTENELPEPEIDIFPSRS